MCMYAWCIQPANRSYIPHTGTYFNPYWHVWVCICMYLGHVFCMYVYVWRCMLCIYFESVLYCMYLPVFFAGKIASRPICTTYRQYTLIHTNITRIKLTYIHIHTKIHANTCKNTYIKQVRKKCICCLLSAIFACMFMYVCYMCSTCEVLKSIHMCMYCLYVYTCVYMLLHL